MADPYRTRTRLELVGHQFSFDPSDCWRVDAHFADPDVQRDHGLYLQSVEHQVQLLVRGYGPVGHAFDADSMRALLRDESWPPPALDETSVTTEERQGPPGHRSGELRGRAARSLDLLRAHMTRYDPPVRSLLSLGPLRNVVVLTGAGVSVASGLPTYRGAAGLWTKDPGLADELRAGAAPEMVWRALVPLRATLATTEPNAAHHALAAFERAIVDRGGAFTLVTQNIDGLHQKAGSARVVEYHGALRRSRCSACSLEPFDDDTTPALPPPCPRCGAPLRPDVVLFDETIGATEEVTAKRALRDCDLFLAVGTSGTVWPASSFVRAADYAGAHTVLVNAERIDGAPFREVHVGRAEELLPTLLAPRAS